MYNTETLPAEQREKNEYMKGVAAQAHALNHSKDPANLPIHQHDELLNQPIAAPESHNGYTLDLTPAAFKKHELELMSLIKAEGNDNDLKIIQTVQFMEQNQEALEQIKQANPEAYQAINQVLQSLMQIFKETRGESIKAVAQQMELEGELGNQLNADSPDESPEAQPMNVGGPRTDEKPHNHRITYAAGTDREHGDNQKREKQQDGSWKNVTSGIANPKE
jgi:hypothetical protein